MLRRSELARQFGVTQTRIGQLIKAAQQKGG